MIDGVRSRGVVMDLSVFSETFAANRKLTYDLLDHLGEPDLERKWPRPGLDTFAKHFAEMAAVQQAFILALISARMDFSSVPDVFSFADEPKQVLRRRLQDADSALAETLAKKKVSSTVSWDDTSLPVEQHFTNLVSHEVFHHGMMVMALYQLGLPIPESWRTSWALPPSSH